MSETLSQGLERFKAAMTAKFELRATKHGERSVTLVGDRHLRKAGVYHILVIGLSVVSKVNTIPANPVSSRPLMSWWRN